MRVFPATGLVVLAALFAALSLGLVLTPLWWAVLLPAGAVLAMLVILDYRWLRAHVNDIDVDLVIPESRVRGEPIPVALCLTNQLARPARVQVRLCMPPQGIPSVFRHVVPTEAGQTTRVHCVVETPVRGAYVFGDIYRRFSGPWSMLVVQVCHPCNKACKVYPDVKRVRDYIVSRRAHMMAAPRLSTTRLRGVGSEFESLRDYELGDDIRRIDWKATAKHQRFITRNYEIEPYRDVLIMLDKGRLMAGQAGSGLKFDHAVDTALMLTAVALENGDHCGLLLFDREVAGYLPPRGGTRYLSTVVEALYDVQPNLEESHFLRAFAHVQSRMRKRGLIIILTDLTDVDVSRSFLHGVLALGKRHLVILAALRTPAIYDVIAAPTADELDPLRKAVAYRLVHERREVLTRMEKGGISVLDVPPEALTVPLVNKYIELREHNRL